MPKIDHAGVSSLEPKDRLLYWIKERHNIYLRKQVGKLKPWTADPILQRWFFTNPYRENDKVTVWVRENIRQRMVKEEPATLLFALIAFRWFNTILTGSRLLHNGWLTVWNADAVIDYLGDCKEDGDQIFTGAFMIHGGTKSGSKLMDVCRGHIQAAWDRRYELCKDLRCTTLENAHKVLSSLPGMGGTGFMAAQVVCDLKYTALLAGVTDWWTWCSSGPGSLRGMAIIEGKPESKNRFAVRVNGLRSWINKELTRYGMSPLHCQDMQSCLCEFSKYERARAGGRNKRTYPGS